MTSGPTNDTAAGFDWAGLSAQALASVQGVELPSDLQIPSLPTALTKFLQLAEDPDVDVRKLGAVIERDPGLTIDLLKCVNVASRGAKTPVKTPTDAIVRLGVSSARSYLMSAGMKSATLGFESRLMNHRNFWNESLQRALFAQHAAKDIGADPETAFMGGLLQDFILPVLTNHFDEQYIKFLREDATEGRSLTDWEQETFGWDHAAVGAVVAGRWNLPEDLLCAIFFHHQMELPLKAPDRDVFNLFPVTLAALLPDQLRQEHTGINRLLDADSRSERFQLTRLCELVDSELEQACEGIDQPVCLSPVVQAAREMLLAQA